MLRAANLLTAARGLLLAFFCLRALPCPAAGGAISAAAAGFLTTAFIAESFLVALFLAVDVVVVDVVVVEVVAVDAAAVDELAAGFADADLFTPCIVGDRSSDAFRLAASAVPVAVDELTVGTVVAAFFATCGPGDRPSAALRLASSAAVDELTVAAATAACAGTGCFRGILLVTIAGIRVIGAVGGLGIVVNAAVGTIAGRRPDDCGATAFLAVDAMAVNAAAAGFPTPPFKGLSDVSFDFLFQSEVVRMPSFLMDESIVPLGDECLVKMLPP